MLDIPALRAYLGDDSAGQWDDAELERALVAEATNQATRVRYPRDLDGALLACPDLDEALLRRVARNLAMRKAPLGIAFSTDGVDTTRLGSNDPEIQRLENPYRPMVFG